MVKTGRLAWLVWVIGVFAYAAAIMQRTSLGVLGQQTSDHFGTSVSIISTFVPSVCWGTATGRGR